MNHAANIAHVKLRHTLRDGSEMCWIPPGPFRYQQDQVLECTAGFYLARYPVTRIQYFRYVRDAQANGKERVKFPGELDDESEQCPMTHVSILDALAYASWAGGCLPTEVMWEYAARGPEGRTFPWGEEAPSDRLANVNTHLLTEVNAFPETRTPFGCEDLIGNVSEWTIPVDDPTVNLPSDNDSLIQEFSARGKLAVVRGAPSLKRQRPRMLASHRRRLSARRRNRWVGFRIAMTALD